MKKALKTLSLLVALTATTSALAAPLMCATAPAATDNWPTYTPGKRYEKDVTKGLQQYKDNPMPWWTYMPAKNARYTWNSDYMGSANQQVVQKWSLMRPDDEGIPVVKYGDTYYRNPATIAQNGLKFYGRFLRDRKPEDRAMFLKHTDALLKLQDENGAVRAPYPFKYVRNKEEFKPGWVNSLAQGQALSVYARAYRLTQDVRYLNAGRQATMFFLKTVAEGGVLSNLGNLDPSLSRYLWLEEYPNDAVNGPNHVLNGFLYALLGLYDWGEMDKGSEAGQLARQLFACGAYSAAKTLPYFDLGGFSAYDMGHVVKDVQLPGIPVYYGFYQGAHLYLFLAMDATTDHPEFKAWAKTLSQQIEGVGGSPLVKD